MTRIETRFLSLIVVLLGFIGALPLLLVTGYSGICPIGNKTEIGTWCKKTFQTTGNVTVGNGTVIGEKIECVCNNASFINVSLNPNPSADSQSNSILPIEPGDTKTEALCFWFGVFEDMPEGNYCTSMTGANPVRCNETDTSFCFSSKCISEGNDYTMTCNTCDGRVFTIVKKNEEYKRTYSSPTDCNPKLNCSSHGCCNTQADSRKDGVCKCYRDPEHGYWDSVSCSECLKGYKSGNGNSCTIPTPSIQVILSSIATPMTMVLPNLAVLVIFVIFGRVRRLWDTDTRFRLTSLRRANLSTVQSGRRGEMSMFRSKQIPRRPARSKGFTSDSQTLGTHGGDVGVLKQTENVAEV